MLYIDEGFYWDILGKINLDQIANNIRGNRSTGFEGKSTEFQNVWSD